MMAPVMPVRITSTAVREGMPPSFSAMPMATGVVTDLGAIETSDSPRRPSAQVISTAPTTRRHRAGQQRRNHRDEAALHRRPVLVERDGERDGRRPQQEMHELRALEIGLAGRAGRRQQRHFQQHRDRHRVDKGRPPAARCAFTPIQ